MEPMNYIQSRRERMTSPELILAVEAERLLNENPSWPYEKIINKIKEIKEGQEWKMKNII